MSFTADLPKIPGTYRHRWIDHAGRMREQTLFVGYTNAKARLLQGTEPNAYMPRKLKCCPPEEYLHADRLTPEEWGGWWEHITHSNTCWSIEMTNDEILQAAKEAEQTLYYKSFLAYYAVIEQLVRDVERKTIERCAAICDSVNNYDNPMTATDCAAAIRKLGEQE